ncbi:MAG: NADH-quinone reductase [Desulfobacteraceae bacterium]
MEVITISRGFMKRFAGVPSGEVTPLPRPETVALSTLDIPFVRPKLLVKEGERVETGTPVFCDKRDRTILFASPGSGRIKTIVYGQRRQLREVVIALEPKDDFLKSAPLFDEELAHWSREALIDHLKQGGLWPFFRQLPAGDTADARHTPPMIIVSLEGNEPCAPDPRAVLDRFGPAFAAGVAMLEKLTGRVVVTARKSRLERPGPLSDHVTHTVPDDYPCWHPAVVLFHLKKSAADNSAWHIQGYHLAVVGHFLMTGQWLVEKIMSITGISGETSQVLTRPGAPIRLLTGDTAQEETITTGMFTGREVLPESHLGLFENSLTTMAHGAKEQLFGFIKPGVDVPTASRAFASAFLKRRGTVDATRHGEERACINCSYCEKICPNDLMPGFIMKSLVCDDMEEALEMGLMDCAGCGLCSYACPCKIELAEILAEGMAAHHRDKVSTG